LIYLHCFDNWTYITFIYFICIMYLIYLKVAIPIIIYRKKLYMIHVMW